MIMDWCDNCGTRRAVKEILWDGKYPAYLCPDCLDDYDKSCEKHLINKIESDKLAEKIQFEADHRKDVIENR